LGQALWRIKTQNPGDLARVQAKAKVYDIYHQDNSSQWMRDNFLGMTYILNEQNFWFFAYPWQFYCHTNEELSYVSGGAGSFYSVNLATNHGPLTASLGDWASEGDSPSFFHFLPTGLGGSEDPSLGGWGGRFYRPDPANKPNYWLDDKEITDICVDDGRYPAPTHSRSGARWIPDIQREAAARADWCITGYANANHPPRPVVNGSGGLGVIRMNASAGSQVNLSAAGSTDPDNNALSYTWWVYPDAGTYSGNVTISNSTSQSATVQIPSDANGKTISVALTVRDNGLFTLARWKRIQLTVGSGSGGNQSPSVSITAPSGNTFTAPASIPINANASDPDGSISKVDFYQGSTLLGSDASSPYSYTWNNVAAGSYSLTARATDNAGAVTTSAVVAVTVNGTPGTAGFYRAINVNGDALTIDGNAWESGISAGNYSAIGGTFSAQSVTLNPATDAARSTMIRSSVYGTCSVTLSSVPNNSYNVYLYAWEDNSPATFSVSLEGSVVQANYTSGAAGTWARLGPWPVTISDGTINVSCSGGDANISGIEVWSAGGSTPGNQAPVVALTAPATAPGSFAINATAADSDGTIAKVEFFAGATRLGEDTSAPYTYTWNNVAAGTYSLTAKATDNAGAITTSTAVSVTVMDLQTVRDHFGTRLGDPGWTGQGDANGDGRVDAADVSVVVRALGN